MGNNYKITFITPDEFIDTPEYYHKWYDLSLSIENLYSFYQLPIWWQYSTKAKLRDHVLRLRYGGEPLIAVMTDKAGKYTGVTGVFLTEYLLNFRFKNRVLTSKNISVIRLMGGQPLIIDKAAYIEFVKAVFDNFPECDVMHIPWVPIGSECWYALLQSGDLQKIAKTYVPEKDYANHYSIKLDQSFETYLNKFSKKAKYNLKRELKLLKYHANEQLSLVRIEQASDVKMFLDGAVLVSSQSWQHTLEQQMDNSPDEIRRYERLANMGVLRCYLLKCGEITTAFVRGFQFGDMFYYSRTGYDESLKTFSPGKVLFYLMLEDLFFHRKPAQLNFQEGDCKYKSFFSNDNFPKTDILLIRRDAIIRSNTLIYLHKLFNVGITKTKQMLAHLKST